MRRGVEQDIGIAEHLLHLVGVANGAGHDGAGAFGIEVGHRQLVEVFVHPVLHVEHDALADARAQPPHGYADGIGQHDQDEQEGHKIAGGPEQLRADVGQIGARSKVMAEERERTAAHHAIDIPRQAGGGEEVQHRVDEVEQIHRPELAAVGPDEFQRPPQQVGIRAGLGAGGGGLRRYSCRMPSTHMRSEW